METKKNSKTFVEEVFLKNFDKIVTGNLDTKKIYRFIFKFILIL